MIDGVSFSLNENDKMALIGEEGNGKSTLMKAILDKNIIFDFAKVKGDIDISNERIGYLPQHMDKEWDDSFPFEYLLKNSALDLINPQDYNRLEKYTNTMEEMRIDKRLLEEDVKIKNLSGGEKVKLQLIKLYGDSYSVLFLDEPTNDLDISSLEFLEKFIIDSKIPVLFISHDETLLENAANRILHLEQPDMKTKQKYTVYNGGYREYLNIRDRLYEKEIQISKKEKAQYMEKLDRLNDIRNAVHAAQNNISRQDPKTGALLKKKMHSVKSMERRFEKESYSKVTHREEAINVFFEKTNADKNKKIADIEISEFKIGERLLINNVNLLIKGKDKIVITGDNGTGKSLLLKKIYREIKEKSGKNVFYMPQSYMDELKDYDNPIHYLLTEYDKDDISYSRQLLGAMKFLREEMISDINSLSDGQKAKLFILKAIKTKAHVLILDEPTRNFSPLSNKVIRSILYDFDGAIISTSHDRRYIKEVADIVYSIENKELKRVRRS